MEGSLPPVFTKNSSSKKFHTLEIPGNEKTCEHYSSRNEDLMGCSPLVICYSYGKSPFFTGKYR